VGQSSHLQDENSVFSGISYSLTTLARGQRPRAKVVGATSSERFLILMRTVISPVTFSQEYSWGLKTSRKIDDLDSFYRSRLLRNFDIHLHTTENICRS